MHCSEIVWGKWSIAKVSEKFYVIRAACIGVRNTVNDWILVQIGLRHGVCDVTLPV